jgi:uncharacterized protein YyaL (SSP411 family)
MADRLKDATSPYLLQHAGNPVDWWPWCDDAFAQAREREVPVLLSVGYSACHWCHVMAHESFEDGPTAALMNEHLVSIKVDREERPDVDAVYMAATQAMTGQGGWPMTVFMTPDREPFHCGTYFPREYFQRLVLGVAQAWRDDRGSVTGQAQRITVALAERAAAVASSWRPGGQAAGSESPVSAEACQQAVTGLAADYDTRHGGFGGAPKFPPSMVLEFLLRHSERCAAEPDGATGTLDAARVVGAAGPVGPAGPAGTGVLALELATGTAEAMARGGMYDQLGGGFARYSVDGGWVVPHFEKMLYDNALLARVYAHLWRRTGSGLARRVAAQTCAWMIAELRTTQGGFAAALDADSDGAEGKFYVWTPDELTEALGANDGEFAAAAFGVTESGTFEHGASVLQLRSDPADAERLARIRQALLAARAARVRPARDDKIVAAWNGLAIAALAETGALLDRPDFTAAARAAAELLTRVHLADGRLARTSRDGAASGSAGVLEDYACVAEGFLALSGSTGEARWVQVAGQLLDTALDRFRDPAGGFYDTADDGEQLIYRPVDPADGPSPSGVFAVAGALLSYSALTGSARHRGAAAEAIGVLPAVASRYPRAAGWGLAVAEAFLSGPAEIAIVGPPGDERTAALHAAALHAAPPGAVIAVGDGGGAGGPLGDPADPGEIPLLAGRGLLDGGPAAYVCRNFACRAPVGDPDQLRAVLRG